MASINFYCGVIKQGNKAYLINPFTKLSVETIVLDKEEYVRLSDDAYDYVVNVLDLEHREPECKIYIELPFDFETIVDMSMIKAEDSKMKETTEDRLEAIKTKAIRMMNELISNQMMISNFELFHFFKLNHYLESKGYFITDENREEKYLEVINSGDEKALEVLSEYLDSLDEFNAIDDAYSKYNEYKTVVKSATSEKEIMDAYYELAGKLY